MDPLQKSLPEDFHFPGSVASKQVLPSMPYSTHAAVSQPAFATPSGPIEVLLSAPEKHGEGGLGKAAFVTYLVTARVRDADSTTAAFRSRQMEVRRRYGDFYSLHSDLYKEFPAVILPPLPSKKRWGYLDRFSEEFIEKRRIALERYLIDVVRHPALRQSAALVRFLEEADWGATSFTEHGTDADKDSGVLDSMSDAIINAFSKIKHSDEKFAQLAQEAAVFEENAAAVEKHYGRAIKSMEDVSISYSDLAFDIQSLAALEPGMASFLDPGHAYLDAFAKAWQLAASKEDRVFICCMHRLVGYAQSVKDTLRTRDQKQIDFESLSDYLESLNLEREKLSRPGSRPGSTSNLSHFIKDKYDEIKGTDPERIRQDRLGKTESKISELQAAVRSSKEVAGQFSEQVLKEMQYYEEIRVREIQCGLSVLCESQVSAREKMLQQLDRFLETVEGSATR